MMSAKRTAAIGPGLRRAAYRGVLLVYGIVFCGGYIPVMLFFMPSEPFMVGQARALARRTSLAPTGPMMQHFLRAGLPPHEWPSLLSDNNKAVHSKSSDMLESRQLRTFSCPRDVLGRGGGVQVYLFASNSWRPVTRLRTEVEMRVQQATDVAELPRDLASTESFGDIQLSGNGHSSSARHLLLQDRSLS